MTDPTKARTAFDPGIKWELLLHEHAVLAEAIDTAWREHWRTSKKRERQTRSEFMAGVVANFEGRIVETSTDSKVRALRPSTTTGMENGHE